MSTNKTDTFFNPIYWHPVYWPAWLGFGILWLITRLPHRTQIRFGGWLGKILYLFPSKLKDITSTNIRLCFPELTTEQHNKLVQDNFISLGIGLIEAAMAWWLPENKIQCLFEVNGFHYAEEAFKKGKGIVLVGPHFTCLEIVGRILGMKYAFAVMYRPHKKRLVAFIHERFRKKHYMNYVPNHKIRQMLNVLNNNMAIWYAYDIDGGHKHSVFAPLFGIQTSSLTSVSRIVRLSGAAVIPISFHRRDDLKYEVNLGAPLENFPTGDLVKDATQLNIVLEEAIRECPQQYVWQYKRFKTRPPGEARFY